MLLELVEGSLDLHHGGRMLKQGRRRTLKRQQAGRCNIRNDETCLGEDGDRAGRNGGDQRGRRRSSA
jgi:hypothetical protein